MFSYTTLRKPPPPHTPVSRPDEPQPTLIFLSELGVFSYIMVEPLMSQSLSASPCSSRKGHLMDGISASMRAVAAISCMPKDTRRPPWKFSSSASYASTWRGGGGRMFKTRGGHISLPEGPQVVVWEANPPNGDQRLTKDA